ncbi:MAG: hypothetical protein ACOYYS_12120 [Chloroflexota bacterium]
MHKLTHLQALRLIDAGYHALPREDQLALAAHLETCSECRTYAHDMATLGPELAQFFQERWDRFKPKANVTAGMHHPAIRQSAWRKISREFAWVTVGVLAFFALLWAFRFLLPQQSPQPGAATWLPDISPTATPLPTVTPYQPTYTPLSSLETLTPDVLEGQVVAETAAYYATETAETEYSATETALVATVLAGGQPVVESYLSPDGNWNASFTHADCVQVGLESIAYDEFKLINQWAGTERVVAAQLLYCQGIGAAGLDGLTWSQNSRYFYYTTAREGHPDGGCGYWEPDVSYVDTVTAVPRRIGYGPFSPDGTKLAVWPRGSDDEAGFLIVWDVNEAEKSYHPMYDADWSRGPIAWAPDGQSLVYLQSEIECTQDSASQIIWLDLSSSTQSPLPVLPGVNFQTVTWYLPGKLLLSDVYGEQWTYDFNSRSFAPASSSDGTATAPSSGDGGSGGYSNGSD